MVPRSIEHTTTESLNMVMLIRILILSSPFIRGQYILIKVVLQVHYWSLHDMFVYLLRKQTQNEIHVITCPTKRASDI